MWTKISNCLVLIAIIECIVFVSHLDSKEEIIAEDIQTCSKDDKLCQPTGKAKESLKYSDDTSAKAGATEGTPGADGKPPKSGKKSKSKSKSGDTELADCPLCSFTRPLIRNIMAWIQELLTDPMLIMVFNMFKDKVFELGHLTKQYFGYRLF